MLWYLEYENCYLSLVLPSPKKTCLLGWIQFWMLYGSHIEFVTYTKLLLRRNATVLDGVNYHCAHTTGKLVIVLDGESVSFTNACFGVGLFTSGPLSGKKKERAETIQNAQTASKPPNRSTLTDGFGN